MTAFLWAVLVYAAWHLLGYALNRRDGYAPDLPKGSTVLGVWAAYLLVA